MLCLVVFALTNKRNSLFEGSPSGAYEKIAIPLLIGSTVSALLALYAPITQAGWNPARDFGPRLVAYFAGWDAESSEHAA